MREKINVRNLEQSKHFGYNDIYRKFQNQFSGLAHPDKYISTSEYSKSTYIERENSIAQLDQFFKTIGDSFVYVLGYTGIGKSTFITNYFNIFNNNPVIFDKDIYFPIYCDPTNFSNENFEKIIISKLSSLRKTIEKEFNYRVTLNNSDSNFIKLYEFIYQNKRELLSLNPQSVNETPIQEVESLATHNRSGYELEVIKFYCIELKIRKIVLILDDIESLEYELEKTIVRRFLKIYECLKNRDVSNYYVKCVISGRLTTFRILCEEDWFRAYRGLRNIIKLTSTKDLSQIFKKRFDVLTKIIHEKKSPGNISTWQEAYDILIDISTKLFVKYGQSVLNLNNYNIADSMLDFQKILMNRYWIQGNSPIKSSFDLKYSTFYSNNEKVLKALACGENSIYTDGNHTPIRNIIKNEKKKGKELLYLYVIKYIEMFFVDDNGLAMHCSNIDDLVNNFNTIFNGRYEEKDIKLIIRQLEKMRLIDYPPGQPINNPEEFFLMPRASELWNLLKNNSILMELFREDIWLETEIGFDFTPSDRLDKVSLFADIIKIIKEYFELEKSVISDCFNRGILKFYFDLFGINLITEDLLGGVEMSTSVVFKPDNPSKSKIDNLIISFKNSINEFMDSYQNNYHA